MTGEKRAALIMSVEEESPHKADVAISRDNNNNNNNNSDREEEEEEEAATTTTTKAMNLGLAQLVEEAMQDLPLSDTVDYRTALERAPQIVKTETNPIKFLHREQGNPWSAALRLATHWTFRRHVFGESHWLLPMRVHNNGAMRPQDVQVLRTGAMLLLTPTSPNQRQVILFNLTRLNGADVADARKQVGLYLATTQLNEFSLVNGVDLIMVLDGSGTKVQTKHGLLLQMARRAALVKIHRILLVDDPTDTRLTLRHMFALFVRKTIEKFCNLHQGSLINVTASSREEMRRVLVNEHSLHPSIIPTQLGGDYSYESHFQIWLARQFSSSCAHDSRQTTARDLSSSSSSSSHPNESSRQLPSMEETLPNPQSHSASFDTEGDFAAYPSVAAASSSVTGIPGDSSSAKEQESLNRIFDKSQQRQASAAQQEAVLATNRKSAKRHYYKKKIAMKQIRQEYEALRRHKRKLLAEQSLLMNLWSQAQRLAAEAKAGEGNSKSV